VVGLRSSVFGSRFAGLHRSTAAVEELAAEATLDRLVADRLGAKRAGLGLLSRPRQPRHGHGIDLLPHNHTIQIRGTTQPGTLDILSAKCLPKGQYWTRSEGTSYYGTWATAGARSGTRRCRNSKLEIRNKHEGPKSKIRNEPRSGASVWCFGFWVCFGFRICLTVGTWRRSSERGWCSGSGRRDQAG